MKKLLSKVLILIMSLFDIFYIITNLTVGNMDRMATFIVLFPILLTPFILEKVLDKKLSDNILLLYYIFIFLAQFLGSIVNLYSTITWFDTFTHLLSGIFTALIANLLYEYNIKTEKNKFIKITYIIGFVFMIASIWEFFEFGMDQITFSNLQHSMETGVFDTMVDMIAASIGSLIYLLFRFLLIKNAKIKLFN